MVATSDVLNRTGRPRVFVIWQPVLKTDRDAPNDAARARVTGHHFWDPGTSVARAAQPPLMRDLSNFVGAERLVTGDIVWDYIGVYPPGIRWGDEFPRPVASAAPILDAVDEMLATMELGATP